MQSDQEWARFADRRVAGRVLGRRLGQWFGADVVVLGLSRGGMPVAFEVARVLGAALDVVVVARLSIPWRPEAGMGALAEGGVRIVLDDVVDAAMVSPHDVRTMEQHEEVRMAERIERLRGRAPLMLGGRTVLVVDDGIMTGASARAACRVARRRGARQVVVAVPVAAEPGLRAVREDADDVIALQVRNDLIGVGQGYRDFGPTDEDEVVALLLAAAQGRPAIDPVVLGRTTELDGDREPIVERDIRLPVGTCVLEGRLFVPEGTEELVIIAHDSSRERYSARSRYLAQALTDAGFAVALIDLLTRDEENRGNRFLALDLLSDRLARVTQSVGEQFERIDYVGEGVAAAVALTTAAAPAAHDIHAIVSLGGRPDLAPRLGALRAPVLFIVGEQDSTVLGLTTQQLDRLNCPYRVLAVAGSGHRFREPGALKEAAADLVAWLRGPSPAQREREDQGRR